MCLIKGGSVLLAPCSVWNVNGPGHALKVVTSRWLVVNSYSHSRQNCSKYSEFYLLCILWMDTSKLDTLSVQC